MAQVPLYTLWVSDATDLSTSYEWPLTPDGLQAAPHKAGEVRRYALGRLRIVAQATAQNTLDVTLSPVDRATVRRIEEWQGRPLLVRDPTGRRFFGTYFGPQVTEHGDGSDTAEVSLTFLEVTIVEGL